MKKLLIVVSLVSTMNTFGLSENHLEGLITQAESLVKSANAVSGSDQKMKLLHEAQSIMSVITTYGKDLEHKHSNWLQVLRNHGESVDKFNSEESVIAGEISSLNTKVNNLVVEIDHARKVESAAKKGQMYVAPAVKRAQQAERKKYYATRSAMLERRRKQDLAKIQSSYDVENKIASSALEQSSWPSGDSLTAADRKRARENRTLNSKVATDSARFKESLLNF